MFDRIGKVAVGCFALWALLILLPGIFYAGYSIGLGALTPVFVIGALAAAGLWSRERGWWRPAQRLLGTPPPPALTPPPPPIAPLASTPAAAINEQARAAHDAQQRLTGMAARLVDFFPLEPWENPVFLEVAYLHIHEEPAARQALQTEFERQRGRLQALQTDLERQAAVLDELHPADGAALAAVTRAHDAIEADLSAITAYRDALEARARSAPTLVEETGRRIAQAEAMLTEAAALIGQLDEPAWRTPLLAKRDDLTRLLREARAVLGTEHPRPLTAQRLTEEAWPRALALRDEARAAVTGPERVAARLADLAVAEEHARQTLAAVRAQIAGVREQHPPTAWHDVHGADANASLALDRATARAVAARTAAATRAADWVATATTALDEAYAALNEAESEGGALAAHLERLESAARAARPALTTAEARVDEAWALLHGAAINEDVRANRREILTLARELLAVARGELAAPLPDWLTVSERVTRATVLADRVIAQTPAPDPLAGAAATPTPARLRDARERAKLARDQVQALALAAGAAGLPTETWAAISDVETRYRRMLQLETEQPPAATLLDAYTALTAHALAVAEQTRQGLA